MGPASISTVFSGSAMRMASPWPTSINLIVTFALVCAVVDGAPVSDWDSSAEPCCDESAGETTVGSGCVRAALK